MFKEIINLKSILWWQFSFEKPINFIRSWKKSSRNRVIGKRESHVKWMKLMINFSTHQLHSLTSIAKSISHIPFISYSHPQRKKVFILFSARESFMFRDLYWFGVRNWILKENGRAVKSIIGINLWLLPILNDWKEQIKAVIPTFKSYINLCA